VSLSTTICYFAFRFDLINYRKSFYFYCQAIKKIQYSLSRIYIQMRSIDHSWAILGAVSIHLADVSYVCLCFYLCTSLINKCNIKMISNNLLILYHITIYLFPQRQRPFSTENTFPIMPIICFWVSKAHLVMLVAKSYR
jgi:hypothetical protein